MLDLDVKVSHSVNYILLLGKWYINSSKINKKKIFLCDFINMECIKLTCTLNDKETSFSQSFGFLYQVL